MPQTFLPAHLGVLPQLPWQRGRGDGVSKLTRTRRIDLFPTEDDDAYESLRFARAFH